MSIHVKTLNYVRQNDKLRDWKGKEKPDIIPSNKGGIPSYIDQHDPQKSHDMRWFLVIKTPKYVTTNRISTNKCQAGSSPVTTGRMGKS